MKMRRLVVICALAALALAGCSDPDPLPDRPDAGADADTDSDTDVDTDTDSDTDTDTGAECRRYVDVDAVGTGDGSSWENAYTSVKAALAELEDVANSSNVCQVWVAEGIYYTFETSSTDTVQLVPFVELYGGFVGTETELEARNWNANLTILSGYNAAMTDQVYHLVTCANDTVVDGFIISGGRADGDDAEDQRGGGLLCHAENLVLRNAVVAGNTANNRGGGLRGTDVSMVIENTIFASNTSGFGGGISFHGNGDCELRDSWLIGNYADSQGGGLQSENSGYTTGTEISFENGAILGNRADSFGGGVFVGQDDIQFLNCLLAGNRGTWGEAVHVWGDSTANIVNTVLWGNGALDVATQDDSANAVLDYCAIDGGWEGEGNIDADPGFVGYPLHTGSTWTAVEYDPTTIQTVLTDSSATWPPGELANLFVKPDADAGEDGDPRWAYIVNNTSTEIRVWGDVTDYVSVGDTYETYDLHLAAGSPCIDVANGDDAPAQDIEGYARVDDPATTDGPAAGDPPVDIGAYEYQP